MKLRNYQIEAINNCFNSWDRGFRKILLPKPTRMGKTEVAIAISQMFLDKGYKVCFIAHQNQLVNNAVNRYKKNGLNPYVIQGNQPNNNYNLFVASKPTLNNRVKVEFYNDFFESLDLIIIDEAHISIKQSKAIIEKAKNAKVLLLTATPYTTNGKGLKPICDTVIDCISETSARNEGWKVGNRYAIEKVEINIAKSSTGDYKNKELHQEMKKQNLVANPVEKWLKYGESSTTVVYCVNIEHAHETAQSFRDAGIGCGVINSESEKYECLNENGEIEELETVLQRFRNREFKVICNVGMLTIGYDLPSIRCIIVNLATLSLNKWRQMDRASGVDCYVDDNMGIEGRLKAIEQSSKPYSIIIDLGGNFERHGSHEEIVPFSLSGLPKKPKSKPLCPYCGNEKEVSNKACNVCGFDGSVEQAKRKKKAIKAVERELVKVKGNTFKYKMAKWLWKEWKDLKDYEREYMAFCTDDYLYQFFQAHKKHKQLKGETTSDGYFYKLKERRDKFKQLIELSNQKVTNNNIEAIKHEIIEFPFVDKRKSSIFEVQSIQENIANETDIEAMQELVSLFLDAI